MNVMSHRLYGFIRLLRHLLVSIEPPLRAINPTCDANDTICLQRRSIYTYMNTICRDLHRSETHEQLTAEKKFRTCWSNFLPRLFLTNYAHLPHRKKKKQPPYCGDIFPSRPILEDRLNLRPLVLKLLHRTRNLVARTMNSNLKHIEQRRYTLWLVENSSSACLTLTRNTSREFQKVEIKSKFSHAKHKFSY